jgi:hypothetical protein
LAAAEPCGAAGTVGLLTHRREWARERQLVRSPGGLLIDMGSSPSQMMHYIDYPLEEPAGACNPHACKWRASRLASSHQSDHLIAPQSLTASP